MSCVHYYKVKCAAITAGADKLLQDVHWEGVISSCGIGCWSTMWVWWGCAHEHWSVYQSHLLQRNMCSSAVNTVLVHKVTTVEQLSQCTDNRSATAVCASQHLPCAMGVATMGVLWGAFCCLLAIWQEKNGMRG